MKYRVFAKTFRDKIRVPEDITIAVTENLKYISFFAGGQELTSFQLFPTYTEQELISHINKAYSNLEQDLRNNVIRKLLDPDEEYNTLLEASLIEDSRIKTLGQQ